MELKNKTVSQDSWIPNRGMILTPNLVDLFFEVCGVHVFLALLFLLGNVFEGLDTCVGLRAGSKIAGKIVVPGL